jgi:hypothetical protein
LSPPIYRFNKVERLGIHLLNRQLFHYTRQ